MATRKRSSYDAGFKLKLIEFAILGVRLIDECDLYKSFVPTFNAILGVRLIDECDLYSHQYGSCDMATGTFMINSFNLRSSAKYIGMPVMSKCPNVVRIWIKLIVIVFFVT